MLKILLTNFILVVLLLICANCKTKSPPQSISKLPAKSITHDSTKLPIRLELLSEEIRSFIRESHVQDTSSYLIDTRPVVFQIQGVESDQDQVRYTQPIHRNIEVMIYCLGEIKEGKLVDYGWIENEQGEILWEMDLRKCVHAGGDSRNLKQFESFTMPRGTYRLRYVSNESHANNDWQANPPEYPFYYGITVFNTQVVKNISKNYDLKE